MLRISRMASSLVQLEAVNITNQSAVENVLKLMFRGKGVALEWFIQWSYKRTSQKIREGKNIFITSVDFKASNTGIVV